jgi:hypothetical protein
MDCTVGWHGAFADDDDLWAEYYLCSDCLIEAPEYTDEETHWCFLEPLPRVRRCPVCGD